MLIYGSSIRLLALDVDIREEDIFNEIIKYKAKTVQRRIMMLRRRKRIEETNANYLDKLKEKWYIIYPDKSKFKQIWSLFMIVFFFYTAVVAPFK